MACGGNKLPSSQPITPPAIEVQITRENCPFIEISSAMQISWVNNDNIDDILLIEFKGEQGVITEAGGTDMLQPRTTFSIASLSSGEYIYYCSKNRLDIGTILVTE